MVMIHEIRRSCPDLPHHRKGDDDAHYAERICHGAAQSGPVDRKMHLLQGLLGRAESRSIGGGPAEDAYHVRHLHPASVCDADSHKSAKQNHPEAKEIELHSPLAEGTEESGAYLKAQLIDEKGKPETLGEVEHLRVDGESDMSGQNTDEEDKRHAEADPHHPDLAESQSGGYDDR